jgi:tetratricopeptide (TPR) repeat protein
MGGMVLTSGLAAYALMQRAAAQRETVRAVAETRTAQETTRFLVDLFKISDPSEARGNQVTAREMLDKGAARIDHELAREPGIQATLMDTLGTVYMGLGLVKQARPLLDRSVATRRHLKGLDPLDLSSTLRHQGDVLTIQAEYAGAEKAYQEAIRIQSAHPHDRQSQVELADTLYGLSTLLSQEEKYALQEQTLRKDLALQQSLYTSPNPAIARTLKDLARAVADGGDIKAAIPVMRRAVAMQRALRGNEPHPDLSEVLNDMGLLLYNNGDLDGAEKFYRESLAMNRRLYGEKHYEIANGLENVAMTVQDRGDLEGAEALYRQSLAMRRDLFGETHPLVARTLANLALLQYDRGETNEALTNMREVLVILRKVYPGDNPEVARMENIVGFWQTLAGQYDEADRSLKDALAMRRRLFDDRQPDVASSLVTLAFLRIAQGQYSEALELSQSGKSIDTAAFSADHWRTAIAESAEGAALTGLSRYSEAQARLTHCYAILSQETGAPRIYRSLAKGYLDTLHQRERHGGGAASLETALSAQAAKPHIASATK